MPKVIFIEPTGVRREVQAPAGISLMEAARQNQVHGIVALCGGACACATCHVYIAPQWCGKIACCEEMEAGMLETAWQRRDNSRLSCQIPLAAALDGIEVIVPERQGGEAARSLSE
jgi:2Fe-2S ferredoxin